MNVLLESQDKKVLLFGASLNVQKTFDVVYHKSLLDKLHDKDMTEILWKLKDAAYIYTHHN